MEATVYRSKDDCFGVAGCDLDLGLRPLEVQVVRNALDGHGEYFHNLQDRWVRTSRDVAPLWLIEGSADYFAYRLDANFGMLDQRQRRSEVINQTRGIVSPLGTMDTLKNSDAEDYLAPYMMGYLAGHYGEDKVISEYWHIRSTASSSSQAFEKTFGISLGDFYRQFEEYRAKEFPAYCILAGGMNQPTPSSINIRFDRQLAPGDLSFKSAYWSQAPFIPYIFCVSGLQFGLLTDDDQGRSLRLPSGAESWLPCGGNCLVVYMRPQAPAGTYTVQLELPDKRRATTTFEHLK